MEESGRPTVRHGCGNLQDYSGVSEQAGGENVCRTGGSSFAAVKDRRAGESVATYVAELRSPSEFCNFGNTLEVMIRDRFVCGINDRAIQKRLLAEPKLTYVKAVEIAQTTQTAAQSMQKLQVKSESDTTPSCTTDPCREQTSGTPSGSGPTSYCCGNKGHTVAKCRMSKRIVCHNCGKTGDIQKVCRSKRKGKSSQCRTGKHETENMRQGEFGEETDPESSDSDMSNLCNS